MKHKAELVAVVGLAILVAAGLSGSGYLGQISEFSWPGKSTPQFAISLEPAEIDAELARLRGLPGGGLPADLGTIANARVNCTVAFLEAPPGAAARNAAFRYYLIILAMRKNVSSPLIDPRAAAISLGKVDSLDDPAQLWELGEITEATFKQWDRVMASYREATHPVFNGLNMDQSKWAFADFGKIVSVGLTHADRIRACYRARAAG
jgi:hypothetical protein